MLIGQYAHWNPPISCMGTVCFPPLYETIETSHLLRAKGGFLMVLYNDIKKNTYYDSVTLMLVSGNLSSAAGVKDASVMMGTDHNKSIMAKAGILSPEAAEQAGPNDLIIGILAKDENSSQAAITLLEDFFAHKANSAATDTRIKVKTLPSAIRQLGKPNFAIVSIPGKYAANEAMKAMQNQMHVLLFSDNVSIEEENRLKNYAVEHNLLMMGPDCGTAIINGAALGFANIVRRGDIGLVAAAGTGLQEVSVLIDRMGGGISQALGTGGRDIKSEIGGKMMLMALQALAEDPMTRVIGIIAKPPAPDVMQNVMAFAQSLTKPVVACFLGADYASLQSYSVQFAETLEDTAAQLVQISLGFDTSPLHTADISSIVQQESSKYTPAQTHIRGLYSGGSLCYESILLLERTVGRVHSNITHDKYALENIEESVDNTFIDMGDDYFTDGMPHPMIDPRLRVERIKKEVQDESVAIVLLDCVLGYGSHANPASALANAILDARKLSGDRHITYIASVCGTDHDFQNRAVQEEILRSAGVIVTSSNAQAAKLASELMKTR